MPPRAPTPRQREVLEAMSRGLAISEATDGTGYVIGDGRIQRHTITALANLGWIKQSEPRIWIITESGRRAVARSDGGV